MAEQRDAALLLRRIPWGETSLICHFLTAEHGRIALMARGARRAKSAFRATLAPLHVLALRWRPGRKGMGTLLECARGEALASEAQALEGLELLALAARLFIEGDPHGYAETRDALARMATLPAGGRLHAGCWQLLAAAGWVGGFGACWQCGAALSGFGGAREAFWMPDARLVCGACRQGGGRRIEADDLARLAAWMPPEGDASALAESLAEARGVLPSWAAMIRDVLRRHGVRHRVDFSVC